MEKASVYYPCCRGAGNSEIAVATWGRQEAGLRGSSHLAILVLAGGFVINRQAGDKVEVAFEHQRDWKQMQYPLGIPLLRTKADFRKSVPPLLCRPVIVGQYDTVMGIADPFHDFQRCSCQYAVHRMILEFDCLARNALGFPEHDGEVVRMMQHIDEHHDIEGFVFEREVYSIKIRYENMRVRPGGDVDVGQRHVRELLLDERVDHAVTVADNQDGPGIARQDGSKLAS